MSKRREPLKSTSRGKETRDPTPTDKLSGYISLSLLHFQNNNNHPGQSLKTWNDENQLLGMLNLFHHITSHHISQLQSGEKLTLYGDFPSSSEFVIPEGLENKLGCKKDDINWGVIKSIGGQKLRIAGFLYKNVFYVVYLDRDHKFCPTKKKHT